MKEAGFATLRSLMLASVLSHSDNRWICGFAFGYAQISPYGETYRGLKL